MQPTEPSIGTERPAPPSLEAVRAAFPQLAILDFLGQGGMGWVFKARQPKLNRLVALKLLPSSLAERDAAFAGRFEREGELLARLHHPNIVAVHDSGTAGEFFFLLMEYVEGVNLRQAMRSSRFAPTEALAIVPRICDALQYAHDEGVLHRDIKPENILLDAKGRVKLVDFGIAKLIGAAADDAGAGGVEQDAGANLTQSGTTLGTPSYMAPEQRDTPADVDHRADIYSLGVVFYEMLTGELPAGAFTPPSAVSASDPRVDAIVRQALEKERTRRQGSADEVKTQVETIAGGNATPDLKDGQRADVAAPGRAGAPADSGPPAAVDRVARMAKPTRARNTRKWIITLIALGLISLGASICWRIFNVREVIRLTQLRNQLYTQVTAGIRQHLADEGMDSQFMFASIPLDGYYGEVKMDGLKRAAGGEPIPSSGLIHFMDRGNGNWIVQGEQALGRIHFGVQGMALSKSTGTDPFALVPAEPYPVRTVTLDRDGGVVSVPDLLAFLPAVRRMPEYKTWLGVRDIRTFFLTNRSDYRFAAHYGGRVQMAGSGLEDLVMDVQLLRPDRTLLAKTMIGSPDSDRWDTDVYDASGKKVIERTEWQKTKDDPLGEIKRFVRDPGSPGERSWLAQPSTANLGATESNPDSRDVPAAPVPVVSSNSADRVAHPWRLIIGPCIVALAIAFWAVFIIMRGIWRAMNKSLTAAHKTAPVGSWKTVLPVIAAAMAILLLIAFGFTYIHRVGGTLDSTPAALADSPFLLQKLPTEDVIQAGLSKPISPWAWQELDRRPLTAADADQVIDGLMAWLQKDYPAGFTEPLNWVDSFLDSLNHRGLVSADQAFALVQAIEGQVHCAPRLRLREGTRTLDIAADWRNPWLNGLLGLKMMNEARALTVDGRPVALQHISGTIWELQRYDDRVTIPALAPGKHIVKLEVLSALVREADLTGIAANAPSTDWPSAGRRWTRTAEMQLEIWPRDAAGLVSPAKNSALEPIASGGLSVKQIILPRLTLTRQDSGSPAMANSAAH